jgi:hypothetical protein
MHDPLLRAFHAAFPRVAGVILLTSDGAVAAQDVGPAATSLASRADFSTGASAFVGNVLVVKLR